MGGGSNKKNNGKNRRAPGTKQPKREPSGAESTTTNDDERPEVRPESGSHEQKDLEENNNVRDEEYIQENGEPRDKRELSNQSERLEMDHSGNLEDGREISKHSERSREESSSRNPLQDGPATHHYRHRRPHQETSPPGSMVVPLLQAMDVQDVSAAIEVWDETRLELKALRETVSMLENAQREALTFVDRFHPTMDQEFEVLFQNLNSVIGPLVKEKPFLGLAQEDPLRSWDEGAFFVGSISRELRSDPGYIVESNNSKVYLKLLLYHTIWKFLDENLFDSSKPFEAYSNIPLVDKYVHNSFRRLFYSDEASDSCLPPNEEAARWRSSTVARLDILDDDEGRQNKVKELISDFSKWVHEKMAYGKTVQDAEDLFNLEPKLGKYLGTVFKTAVGLARLIAQQRAFFCLRMPDLHEPDLRRMNPTLMTTLGSTGVRLGNSDEADGEAEGQVMFCASPMLVKWGNGQGTNFQEATILVKSFVQIFEKS
ncbi:hypothetical protein EDB81DRAFT_858150 [Dactylonectria macrodidyma]|uniref:Uncharacterized protein n=1 Tax=Dactylonectria macrodidyma TaxID=307937 RepID=A0A9P9EQ13_9HYPO|nr:hypothetical protein EDB81DRAFT_858150 [Dactylonectria macrodidyma]